LTQNLQGFLLTTDAALLTWDPNLAADLVAEGMKVGIDPRLFASIATLESGHGGAFSGNNPFGLGPGKTYSSPGSAVAAEGNTLFRFIYGYGETTVSSLYSGNGFKRKPGRAWGVLQYPAYCYGSNAAQVAACQAAGVTVSGFLSSQPGLPAVALTPGNPNNLGFPCP
jgi:hypothetical protein